MCAQTIAYKRNKTKILFITVAQQHRSFWGPSHATGSRLDSTIDLLYTRIVPAYVARNAKWDSKFGEGLSTKAFLKALLSQLTVRKLIKVEVRDFGTMGAVAIGKLQFEPSYDGGPASVIDFVNLFTFDSEFNELGVKRGRPKLQHYLNVFDTAALETHLGHRIDLPVNTHCK